MATGTNAIATELEVANKLSYDADVSDTLCCTKSRAIYFGANSAYLTDYTNNLLVKYSDIVKKETLKATTAYFSNVYVGAVFLKPSGYNDYDFYIKINATVSYGEHSASKETDIKLYPNAPSDLSTTNGLDVPSGYIGIDSGNNPLNADGHMSNSFIKVIPDLYYYYSGANPPTEFTCKLSISLYAISLGSSNSALLIRLHDTSVISYRLYNGGINSNFPNFSYDDPNYSTGMVSPNIHYPDIIVLFDSQTTRNAVVTYWENS